jgi:CRP/FNR family transcriptional regulator, cyclic AMP receptor protein
MSKISEPKFRFHRDCEALTELTLSHLPTDGSLGRARLCRKDSSVWHFEDLANSVYFLRRGQVKVVADGTDGREVVLRMVRAGQLFGELCFCSGKKSFRLSSALAIVDSEVLEIELSHFLAYMQDNLPTLASFVFTFCKLLSDSHHRIEILACRGADERLGKLLLQLATSRGRRKQQGGKISLTLSHSELAQMAAMSRPHVSVTMGNFRRRGLVQYGRNSPLLVNMQRLSAYVKT